MECRRYAVCSYLHGCGCQMKLWYSGGARLEGGASGSRPSVDDLYVHIPFPGDIA